MGFTNFYLGHGAPSDWGEDKRTVSKSSQRALCRTHATSPRIHFSLFFFIYLILCGPPTCAPLSMDCVKIIIINWSVLSLFSYLHPPTTTIYLPPSSCPSTPQSILPPTPHNPPALALHPAFTHLAPLQLVCMWVWENLSETSLSIFFPPPLLFLLLLPLRGLTASQRGQWRHCQQPGHEKCIA